MRQFSLKLILGLGMLLPLFYGCGNDDDGPDLVPPTINDPADIEVNVGATATISYSVTTSGGYASAAVVSSTPANATAEVTSEPADGSASGTVVVTVMGVAEGTTTVTLTVTDNQNQNANNEVGVTVNAVDTPDPETGDTFASPGDTIAAIAELSTLADALDTAGLTETLNASEQVTIFAPNNAAFTALLGTMGLADLDALVDSLTSEGLATILQAHVVTDSLSSVEVTAAAVSGDSLQTLNPNAKLGITQVGDSLYVNGAAIVQADIFTSNGVIHVINSVVNLPAGGGTTDTTDVDVPATVVDSIAARDELNSLETALTTTNLLEPLRGDGPFTVFAPDNDAFTALLAAQQVDDLDALIAKLGNGDAATGTTALANILQAHVVPQELLATNLQAQDYTTLIEGQVITITKDDAGNVFANGAQVVTADIQANNGVVHIINAVVNLGVPQVEEPATVVDVVVAQESLSTLETALTEASLVETLRGEGPFTLFAPDNTAFTALLTAQDVPDLAGLIDKIGLPAVTGILQAHVVSGNLLAADLAEQAYPTLTEGRTITITKDDQGNVLANGAAITTPDLVSGNGVVHIINQVVNVSEPPTPGSTIVSLITEREELSSLETTLNTEGVAVDGTTVLASLQGEGPFTIFAPNNTGFQALIDEDPEVSDLNGLIAKLGAEKVARILRAHVVSGRYTFDMTEGATMIVDTDVLTSLEGPTLTAEIDGNGRMINGVMVAESDIVVDNGVVHILNEVVNTSAGNTGVNGFTVTITNESTVQRFFQQGTFGEVENGEPVLENSYSFSFNAGTVLLPDQPTRLSFITSITGEGNTDQFLATPQDGILLYNEGTPITGDITGQISLYDASTEDAEGNDNPSTDLVVRIGPATDIATVSITNDGTLFTVTITNAQTGGPGLSPGVFGVHTVEGPLFRTTQSAGIDGLEALAEDGDPTQLSATMAANDGFVVPLSPGVYAVHTGASPVLAPGATAADYPGLEALAEDGVTDGLAATLNPTSNTAIKASGVFNVPDGGTDPGAIGTGESYSFVIESAEPGDLLSLATMMVQSNDIVYATSQVGIPLFNGDQPTTGNVTSQVFAYDVGTEVNEYSGAGLNQTIRTAPETNVGPADTNTDIRRVTANGSNANEDDGFIYNPVNQRIRVTITPN